jgi:hypothetical protein
MPAPAGYSGKPLVDKLGIKPGHRISLVKPPPEFTLDGLPAAVVTASPRATALDLILFFTTSATTLRAAFARQAERLGPKGMLWVAWPKKASGVATDLTEDVVRGIGLAVGWVDVKVCAVDEVWSGLKFLRRKQLRRRLY